MVKESEVSVILDFCFACPGPTGAVVLVATHIWVGIEVTHAIQTLFVLFFNETFPSLVKARARL